MYIMHCVLQALQKLHKQEASNSRAACARLQSAMDQASSELALAKVQLQDAHNRHHAAIDEQQRLSVQLELTQQQERQSRQQFEQVWRRSCHCHGCVALLLNTLLKHGVSYMRSSCVRMSWHDIV